MTNTLTRIRWSIWIYVLVAVALVLRFHNLGAQSLWTDEGFSALGARLPVPQALTFLLGDSVHPPLYYFIQRLSFLWGDNEFALRWLAAMFGILTVAAVARVGRAWVGPAVGVVAAIFLALSPFALWYSREARMYSLLMLLNLGVMWQFGRLLAGRANLVVFGLLSTTLYLTHYFGLFAPLIQFVYLLLTFRQNYLRLRVWVVVQFLAALPFAIWIVALYSQGAFFGISWIHAPHWYDPILTLQNFSIGYGDEVWRWVITLLVAVFVGLGFFYKSPQRVLLALWLLLPPFIILLFSYRRPVYVDRFLSGSLPALALLVGVGLWQLSRVRPPLSWLGAATLTVGLGYGAVLLLNPIAYPKEDWRDAAQLIQSQEQASDTILFQNLYFYVPFNYYYHGPLTPQAMDRDWSAQVPAGRLWLIYRGTLEDSHRFAEIVPPNFESATAPPAVTTWLTAAQPYLVTQTDYPGLAVRLYDFSQAPAAP